MPDWKIGIYRWEGLTPLLHLAHYYYDMDVDEIHKEAEQFKAEYDPSCFLVKVQRLPKVRQKKEHR